MMGPDVLGQLLERHGPALVLYARQWCSAPEDVVQEAFLKLVVQKRPPEKVVPWLYRVVRNAALTAARSARRRHQHERAAAARAPAWLAAPDGSGLDGAAATAALQALPLEQREVIVAHLWGGLTFEEVAELVGSSSSTAHRTYQAGLEALRERLGVSCPKKPAIPS